MRKSVLLIGIFAVLGAIALVFALQPVNSLPRPNITNRNPNGSIKTIDPHSVADPVSASNSNVQFEWKTGNPYVLKNGTGEVFLDLRISGKAASNSDRKRMNLVLVIDRSGSMESENKLENVKKAAVEIINNMNGSDQLAIVAYDDSIRTVYPSGPVENKAYLRELVYSLTPGGSTNLCGGMLQGFSEVQKHFRKEQVNRIILLSDGLANAGISEPSQIASEASKIREHRISVSTMGVGLDYNENLMTNIADASGGNYYYISPETSMAEIFRKEWNLMQNMVATNARATFELGTGVKVADVAGFKWDQAGNRLTIQVPDIYSGETRRILVQLQVPTGAEQTIAVGKGTFTCTDISSKTPRQFAASFNPEVRIIKDQTIVMKNLDEEVNKRAASVVASKEMQQAYALYEEGKNDEAFGRAQQVVEKLRALGYVEGDQINRYEQNVLRMDPTKAAPPASAAGKDFLKKQKEEERKVQQNDQQ